MAVNEVIVAKKIEDVYTYKYHMWRSGVYIEYKKNGLPTNWNENIPDEVTKIAEANKKVYLEKKREKWRKINNNLFVDYIAYRYENSKHSFMGNIPKELYLPPGIHLFNLFKRIVGRSPNKKGANRDGIYFKHPIYSDWLDDVRLIQNWCLYRNVTCELEEMQSYPNTDHSTKWFKLNFVMSLKEINSTIDKLSEAYRNGEDVAFALKDALLEAGLYNTAELFQET
ncbi:hypothetical protein C4565_00495 [Candidatus Parcubacteria bacterium]|nr:MAG: hypothetical protein C4565_00495 [Candidatus Parcubacteria bacterium]